MSDSPSSTDGAGREWTIHNRYRDKVDGPTTMEPTKVVPATERDHWKNCHDGQVATKRRLSKKYGDLVREHRALRERTRVLEEARLKALAESERLRDTLERADAEIRRLLAIFARLHLLANFLPGPHAQRIHDEIAEALESPKESPKVSPDETLGESDGSGGTP